jgi:Leucine-rich repeat (LRR) protein
MRFPRLKKFFIIPLLFLWSDHALGDSPLGQWCRSSESSVRSTVQALLLAAGRQYWWQDDCDGAFRVLSESDRLDLNSRGLSDLRPVAELTHLRILNLRGNAIQDVSPLAKLRGLRELDLRGNRISDASALLSLRELLQVDLRDNPLGSK